MAKIIPGRFVALFAGLCAGACMPDGKLGAQDYRYPPAVIALQDSYNLPPADAQSQAITAAAQHFLASLSPDQRAKVSFAFDDHAQRSHWTNLPHQSVPRHGLARRDLNRAQLAALDALLAAAFSEKGMQTIRWQLLSADQLGRSDSGLYFVSFLGAPSTSAPWMFQFGGHHLALNVTVIGPDVSFSPMLTGGHPLHINDGGKAVYITAEETAAAAALLNALTPAQKQIAVQSASYRRLVLGPGTFGQSAPAQGIRGSDLTTAQKGLLIRLIETRLGVLNADDFAAKMAQIRASLDATYFGWWGPQDPPGGAYFRVTGPAVVLEYAPQRLGGDLTDHAHNIYRDPENDYGAAWLGR